MANDKVLIEVVLDDGSVKKAFARISKDAKDAASDAQGSFEKSNDQIGTSFLGLSSKLTAGLALVGVAVAGATAAAALLKKGLDLALDGEKAIALDKVFDRIAAQEGFANLRQDLTSASQGLIDIGPLLAGAAQSVGNLGELSGELPKILALAIDSVKLFGGEAQDRFQTLVRAVETGNTKLLRTQGIIIDSEAVFTKYASALRLTAGELTQAQRQQAILNSVLEVGSERAKLVEKDIQPIGTAYARLSTSISLLSDDIGKAISEKLGGVFSSLLNSIDDFVTKANAKLAGFSSDPANQARSLQFEIQQAEARVIEIQESLSTLTKPSLSNWESVRQASLLKAELVSLQKDIPKFKSDLLSIQSANPTGFIGPLPKPPDNTGTLTADQVAAIQSRNSQLLAFQLAANQQLLAIETARVDGLAASDEKVFQQKALLGQRLLGLGLQQQIELDAAEVTFSDKNAFSLEQREAAKLAIIQKFNALRLNEERKSAAASQEFAKKIAEIIKGGLVQATVAGFSSLGRSLQKGALDFQDFGNAVGSVIGDMLISVGQALIVQGFAIEKFITAINNLFPGAGLAAAAAGAGLVIFGSALKASVGAGGGGSGGLAAGTPGGSPLITTPATETPIDEAVQDQGPQTSVNVNITGDILDSEETGLRIVDILNSAFDKQGVVIKRGVFA